ncbi:MAG: hypothetical protein JRI25_26290, partial [Deltaproteobacteria bacterium]|nr:hypothetical protein [Deltaproteobacteria bacterium]
LSAQTFYVAVRRRAEQGIALVIATHDLVAAERLCDRVALVAGTVPQVETLEGPRSAPAPGRLLTLLQTYGEQR